MTEDDDDDDVTYYQDEDGKVHFTEEGLRHFTEEERGQLIEMHEQLAKRFDEICDHLASKSGHGTAAAALPDELRVKIVNEAEELTERWDEEVEMSDDPKESNKAFVPDPNLQALLAAHHELGEEIMNIRDDAIARECGDDEDDEDEDEEDAA